MKRFVYLKKLKNRLFNKCQNKNTKPNNNLTSKNNNSVNILDDVMANENKSPKNSFLLGKSRIIIPEFNIFDYVDINISSDLSNFNSNAVIDLLNSQSNIYVKFGDAMSSDDYVKSIYILNNKNSDYQQDIFAFNLLTNKNYSCKYLSNAEIILNKIMLNDFKYKFVVTNQLNIHLHIQYVQLTNALKSIIKTIKNGSKISCNYKGNVDDDRINEFINQLKKHKNN